MLAQDIDFHEIFRISPTGMAVLSADLCFVDVNDQFLAEAGRPLEELIGHNFFEIFPKMPADLGDTEWMLLEEALLVLGGAASPGLDGQVEVYELSVRNLTPVIAQYEVRRAGRESPAEKEALAAQDDAPVR